MPGSFDEVNEMSGIGVPDEKVFIWYIWITVPQPGRQMKSQI